ncbi:MAG: tetratricopeptide repeat protein [Nitrospina sp.]|nr:tetratricopeptide repeat protein [Nitrospina sp.]MBT6601476.1 tetratricopeptide repeat protein [Nitrospina sp.]
MFFLRFFYFLFFLNTLAANAFATSPEELLKKAQTLESNGFVEEATKSWEKLILVDTNRNLVIYSQLKLGMAYLKLKQLKKSIKILEGATLSYPDNFDAHFSFGNSLSSFKSFPEAIKSYQQTTTLKPKEGLSHVALSLSLFGNGDSKKAIKALLKANKLFKEKKNISWYRDTRVMIAQIKHFAKFPPHFSNLWLTTNLKLVHETYEKAVFNPKKYLPSASTN